MISIFAVLDKLLAMLQSWVAAQEQKKAQEARDELENNPADWFERHFDGMSSGNTAKDDKADKA